jgi:protein-tyrosine phosphatase
MKIEGAPIRVLFVCLGNICRSPMAEGIFNQLIREEGLEDHFRVDSAGIGSWHIGELPDLRMQATARKNGIELDSRARQFMESDFFDFDYILAMDRQNHRDILRQKPQHDDPPATVYLMRNFDELGFGKDVPDPYYGGPKGFDEVYSLLVRSNIKLLRFIRETHSK